MLHYNIQYQGLWSELFYKLPLLPVVSEGL